MTNAVRDGNRIPIVVGASTADNVTILPLLIDPSTGRVLVKIVSNPSIPSYVYPNVDLPRDGNRVPVMGGASTADNVTIMPIQVDSSTGGVAINYIKG